MKVDNFVLLIISIVTLIVISLLTECNRGRLTELENKAIKEIVETFFHLGSADPTEPGQWGYQITGITEGKYGGRSRSEMMNSFGSHSHNVGGYLTQDEFGSSIFGSSSYTLTGSILPTKVNYEDCVWSGSNGSAVESTNNDSTNRWLKEINSIEYNDGSSGQVGDILECGSGDPGYEPPANCTPPSNANRNPSFNYYCENICVDNKLTYKYTSYEPAKYGGECPDIGNIISDDNGIYEYINNINYSNYETNCLKTDYNIRDDSSLLQITVNIDNTITIVEPTWCGFFSSEEVSKILYDSGNKLDDRKTITYDELQTLKNNQKGIYDTIIGGSSINIITDSLARKYNKPNGDYYTVDDSLLTRVQSFSGHSSNVESVFVSGDYLFTGSRDGNAKMWDADPSSGNFGNEVRTFSGHSWYMYSVFVSGDYLFTGSGDWTAKMWNIRTGELERPFVGHEQIVHSVFVSGDYLFTGAGDDTAKMWDADPSSGNFGSLIRTFEGHSNRVKSVFVSGGMLFTGSYDKKAKMWDADPSSDNFGNEVWTFSGHSNYVESVFVSGDYLFTGSADNTAKMWDTSTGDVVRTFSGHSYPVLSVFVSGDHLFTGSDDNTAKMWYIPELMTFTITNNSGSGGIGSS